ncbi:helix-turn-helix domain-containing protein [Paraflavitalea sp. CAU 1676]|uniref:winged helix-turn-helix transcriptional regulator n=1 Tax=Paraflavitalea sp. CAU 1676 TaxID=3032598 RepID=UPI0023DB9ADB|nr:helix-turn-helix domain-containing protein [Paraflavitalea sp. CAU 1676]MDF2192790.1 helix-turn-helix domain-containing protein [Paraflavitalea sp. CAU 1676]
MAVRKQNSTYSLNEKFITECDLTYAVHLLGGRWKLQLISELKGQKLRFSDLHRLFSHITERMLSLQLRAMEQDGLVKRTVYAEVPPRVEYELTPQVLELLPVLDQLSDWGRRQREHKSE